MPDVRQTAKVVEFDERFLDASFTWLHDPVIARLTLTPPFSPEEQREWFESLPGRTDTRVWGLEVDGMPAGAFGFKGLDGQAAEYFGYLGESALWGRGLGSEMLGFALEWARARGLHRVTLRVGQENARARRLYERHGFVRDSEEKGVLHYAVSLQ